MYAKKIWVNVFFKTETAVLGAAVSRKQKHVLVTFYNLNFV